MKIRPWFWAEWNPRGNRKRWWHFRVWDDPCNMRCLYVLVGLHWIVQLVAWLVHRWQKASHEPSWLASHIPGPINEWGLSTRDYACIHLKVPRSGKPWLDGLIKESLRDELASRALSGLSANEAHREAARNSSGGSSYTVGCAYSYADEMLAQKGDEK